MKSLNLIKVLFGTAFIIFFFGCETDDPIEEEEVIPEIENQIVFWSNFQGPPIEVSVSENTVGSITAISDNPPGCGTSGNVTLTLNPGTYNYSAQENSDPFRTWSGSFNLESNVSCLNFLLFAN